MNFKSLKAKLGLIISLIMLIIFTVVLLYYNFLLNERAIDSSVQILSNAGIKFESELKIEIEKTKTQGNILALFFSKLIDKGELNKESDKLLRATLNNNPNIYRLSIVYFSDEIILDSLTDKQQAFEQKMNFLNMLRTNKGLVKNTAPHIDVLKLKLLKKKLAENDKSIVFEPIIEAGKTGYLPVLTPIFSGQKYLGYIEADISLNWLNETVATSEYLPANMDIFVVSDANNIIATNNKKSIVGDKIKMICPTCPVSSNSYKNYSINGSDLTFCHSINLNDHAGVWHICFKSPLSVLYEKLNYQYWKHFLIGFLLLVLSIILIIIFIDYLTRPFKILIGFAQKVALGDFEYEQTTMEISRKDEIGQLQTAFRGISEALKETAEVSNAIALGDFSKTVKIKSDKDLLASAINKMNISLKRKEDEEILRKSNEKKQKWFNDGITIISDVLKSSQDNTKHLADKIIKTLVKFLDISLGGIYMNELTDDKKLIYRLIAAYAYSEEKFIDKSFYPAESLVGSCASEKRTIYMSNIPEEYIKILSGLGQSAAQSLILIPLVYNNEVFGVLELASLKEISKYEQEFLQKAAENIASTLSLTQTSSQTKDLFIKSQHQANELENRDKQMLSTVNELKELQKETANQEAEVRAKISAMNNTLLVVEYTTEGVLLEANQKFLNSMNYTIEEIQGINVTDLLNEKEKKELTSIINTVKRGNFYEAVVKRHTKYGQEKWLLATFTPVLDEAGVTASILFFATDISRIIAKEINLQDKIEQLEKDSEKTKVTETEIMELHVKQQEKIAELMQSHKEVQDEIFERMNVQKTEDSEKINAYEKMITNVVNQWSNHIDEAEKVIKKKD